jgi:multicomponent Na+:H+ antiporter subunit F
MNSGLAGIAILLLLSLGIGLVRIWRGPGFADRMLAAQLLGTTGIAILLVLAAKSGQSALRDVALVLALLAVLAVLAFVARVWDPDEDGEDFANTRPDDPVRNRRRSLGKESDRETDHERP